MRREIKLFAGRVLHLKFEAGRWRLLARDQELQEREHRERTAAKTAANVASPTSDPKKCLAFHECDGPDFFEDPDRDTDGWPWVFVRRWLADIPGPTTFGQIEAIWTVENDELVRMISYIWCTNPGNPDETNIITAVTGEERPPASRHVYLDAPPTRYEAERLCKEFQLCRTEIYLP